MIKKYYVYAWFNEDTEEIFYIGSGSGKRFSVKNYGSRNQKFIDYYNSHNCDVMFLEVQLTLEEALEKESKYIEYYRSIGQCCCNITIDGKPGTGFGKDNPNFGNDKLKETYKNRPELKDLTKHIGENNGRARKVAICKENGETIKEYACIKYAAVELIENMVSSGSVGTVIGGISKAAKTGKPYKGFYFKFI